MSRIPENLVWAFWAHEPIQFYQRRHADRHSLLGAGSWTPLWYDRIHTREAVARAADMGVNLFYSHFYKGFGLKFEHDEMMRQAELVQIAHEYGIRVCGYCTIGTVYHETLADEFPEVFECVRLRESGIPYHPEFEGGFNCRSFTCYNDNPYWLDYYPQLLKFGLKTVGLDGFHFDNAGEDPCHCPRCTAAFRRWLEDHAGDPRRFALPNFNHVGIPADTGAPEPVFVQWLHYRRDLCRMRHTQVFRQVKALDPEAIVLYNPGIGRFSATGYDPVDTPKEADLAFLETGYPVGITPEGKHVTGIAGFKQARHAGIRPLNASWFRTEYSLRIPETAEEISLMLAESMVYSGVCGSHWLARPNKHGSGMVFDDPVQYQVQKTAFGYFKAHPELYALAKPVAHVHVLYSPETRMTFPEETRKAFLELSETLRAAGVPWDIVTAQDPAPAPEDLVLLPEVTVLADAEGETLRRWQCRMHAIGDAGALDEYGTEREVPVFADGGAPLLQSPFKLDFPDGMAERAIAPDGSELLHLINMRNGRVVPELVLELPFAAEAVEAFSFEEGVTAALAGRKVSVRGLKTLVTLKFKGTSGGSLK